MSEEPTSRFVKKLKTMPSENTVSELIHNHDRISRLSSYFEALRSKKDYFEAVEVRNIKIAEAEVKSWVGESIKLDPDDFVLPELLPFPLETCNLDDLISLHALQNMQPVESFVSMGSNDNADLILWILKEFIFELWGLHHSGATHGNLKPENVLIVEGDCSILESTVIEDDPLSLEWKAPEQILHNTTTKASDMFTFGCILYFCITKGRHPFGETPEQCIQNIMANKADISLVTDYPDAHHLISLLLNPEPELRPMANYVYSHPFFKHPYTKLNILYCICAESGHNKELEDRLKCKIPMFEDKKWRERLLEFIFACTYLEQPFEDFTDVFGGRGSPTFFPTILMEAMNAAVETGFLKNHNWSGVEEGQLLDCHYLSVKRYGFRRRFYRD